PDVSNADAPTVSDNDGNARPGNPATSSSMLGGKVTLQPVVTNQTGISITATNYDQINGLAAGIAGSGSAAVALSAVVNAINDTTTATVGADAKVTASAGNVNVSAASDVHHLAVAAAVAVSGGGAVAPAVDVTVITNVTTASLEAGSDVTASNGDIVVDANATEDMLLVGFGIAGAQVGIGGAVSVLVVNNTTTASVAGTADAWGNVVVHSTDDTDITIVDGAGGFGLGGAGASVGVISLNKTTEAFIANSAAEHAVVHAGGHGAGATGVVGTLTGGEDASGFDTGSVKGVLVEAQSQENVFHLNVAAGGGFIGLAGGVTVTTLAGNTHAYIQNADVNWTDHDGTDADQSVWVNAT
ncbi:MAG TPA: hypothetical protein VFI22_08975, partial [Thermomicrobiales bacterium]|nr:hypothetical protein [Thermomicrobiales bacterium]